MSAPVGPGGPPTVVVPGAGWIDVASRAITQVGFPVVIAAVLLWFLLTRFQDNMNMIVTRMSNNTEVVAKLIERETATVAELQAQTTLLKELTGHSERLVAIQEERQRLLREHREPGR